MVQRHETKSETVPRLILQFTVFTHKLSRAKQFVKKPF